MGKSVPPPTAHLSTLLPENCRNRQGAQQANSELTIKKHSPPTAISKRPTFEELNSRKYPKIRTINLGLRVNEPVKKILTTLHQRRASRKSGKFPKKSAHYAD